VRNLDGAAAAQLKKKAESAGKSLNVFAREALRAAARPRKQEAWAESTASERKSGKYPAILRQSCASGATR
jgi:plasmid stability protein